MRSVIFSKFLSHSSQPLIPFGSLRILKEHVKKSVVLSAILQKLKQNYLRSVIFSKFLSHSSQPLIPFGSLRILKEHVKKSVVLSAILQKLKQNYLRSVIFSKFLSHNFGKVFTTPDSFWIVKKCKRTFLEECYLKYSTTKLWPKLFEECYFWWISKP